MSSSTPSNRWLVVLGAILIQLALGAIYAWSVFTPALKAAPYSFTASQTQWVFSVGLAVFALVMIIAGRLQAKYPPKRIAILGGLILGLGYFLAGFAGTSFAGLVITIGVIGGAGIGLAYVVPIAVGVKWFPDKKGLLTGLAVAGFGFGALIWVKLAGAWGHLIENHGVASVFQMYGVAFAIMVVVGALWMVNPPDGYKPEGWNPPPPAKAAATGAVQMTSAEMLRTPQFYGLWFMFIAGAMAGLMVIGVIALFGIDALKASGLDETSAKVAAGTAMAVFYSLANALGRIGWGSISDKLGRKTSLFLMLLIQGVVMLLFYKMGSTVATFYLAATLVGFNFGGNFALFPAATADYFGNKTVGLNYGWVFSAYGVGGILGPQLAAHFKDAAVGGNVEAWMTPFMIAGIACLAAAAVALTLNTPRKA